MPRFAPYLLCVAMGFTAVSAAAATDLRAGVRLETGTLYLWNAGTTAFNLTGYSLTSSTGDLLPANWLSITANYDANSGGGVDIDNNWLIISQTASDLSEGDFFGDGGLLAPMQLVSLGNLWPTSGAQNLQLVAAEGALSSVALDVTFMYDGDYNGDGTVDSDDYDVWRAGFGTTNAMFLNGDGNRNGVVDAADYTVWRDLLGFTTIPSGALAANNLTVSSATIPEPSTVVGSIIAIILGLLGRRKLVPVPVPVPVRRR